MFECSCGKTYKYASGLTNHKEKCSSTGGGGAAGAGGGGAAGGAAVASVASVASGGDPNDIANNIFFTTPLTSFKPTANFTKEDLEMLEKRKQARLKAILQSQKEQEEKDKKKAADTAAFAAAKAQAQAIATATAAAASAAYAASKVKAAGAAGAGGAAAAAAAAAAGGNVVTNNTSNVGNEEHNASFNINYVPRSEETQQVVRAVTAAAHQYCKGRIIVTSDEPAPGSIGISGVTTTVNADGTTVYNHPTRTISIIETPPEDVSPEEEHDITLEKMTYLILSLIQKNNKLTKENNILRQIVDQLDPTYFD
jgi:hypothetical protein